MNINTSQHQMTPVKRAKNRALLGVLLCLVALFYAVSFIRTGDALRMKAPISRFPAEQTSPHPAISNVK